MLPKTEDFTYSSLLACAMRDRNIHIILIMPTIQQYQIVKTIKTAFLKPTCMVQLSGRHIAVAVGNLREPGQIEIHDISRAFVKNGI